MRALIQDLRFSFRQIRRSPGFMVTAVLTLALGVGANTAIFSLLDQALLRSLPVRDPEQLVILSSPGKMWEGHIGNNGAGFEKSFSYPMYRDLRDRGMAFDGLVAIVQPRAGGATAKARYCERAEATDNDCCRQLAELSTSDRLSTGGTECFAVGGLGFVRSNDAEPAARRYRV